MEDMLTQWMAPIWKGEALWEEPVCFYEDATGTVRGGKLLYMPQNLRLTNHDNTVEYRLHVDYELEGDRIVPVAGGNIPIMKREVYCKPYTGQPGMDWLCLPGREELILIYPEVYRYQLLATYSHEPGEWKTPISGKVLPGLQNKLQAGEPVQLVFFGDSITAGWEASGANESTIDMQTLGELVVTGDRYPHMPVWAQMLTEKLRRRFPESHITKANLAAGSSHTQWGVEHMQELFERVAPPDLVFIGFGMNCMWEPTEVYIRRIREMMEYIRTRNPRCEFVLYPAMVANGEMAAYRNHNMQEFEQALLYLAATEPGITAAPVYSVFRELLAKGKEYYEISGNCVNHPNDFGVRIYGQLIWEAMGLETI